MKRIWMTVLAMLVSAASIPMQGWAQSTATRTVTLEYRWPYPGAQDNIPALLVKGDRIIFAGTDSKYLRISRDSGKTWETRDSRHGLDLTAGEVTALVLGDSGHVLLGATNGIYKSTNDGDSWRKVASRGGFALYVAKNGTIFSASLKIYKSTDNGEAWTVVAESLLSTISSFNGIAETPTGVLLVGAICYNKPEKSEGIFRSTDRGATWVRSNAGLTDLSIESIATCPDGSSLSVYAATYLSGAFVSHDEGLTWQPIREITEKYSRVAFVSPNLGAYLGFMTFTRDPLYELSGASWRAFPGLKGYAILSMAQLGPNRLVIGTHDGVWIATFDNPTPVKPQPTAPTDYVLHQNYPNPFNPTTTIEFSIPKRSYVNLTIYNILGQKVETLVNDELVAGIHRIEWHAGKYPSGIYFYVLEAANFKASKRMLLVK